MGPGGLAGARGRPMVRTLSMNPPSRSADRGPRSSLAKPAGKLCPPARPGRAASISGTAQGPAALPSRSPEDGPGATPNAGASRPTDQTLRASRTNARACLNELPVDGARHEVAAWGREFGSRPLLSAPGRGVPKTPGPDEGRRDRVGAWPRRQDQTRAAAGAGPARSKTLGTDLKAPCPSAATIDPRASIPPASKPGWRPGPSSTPPV